MGVQINGCVKYYGRECTPDVGVGALAVKLVPVVKYELIVMGSEESAREEVACGGNEDVVTDARSDEV